MIGTNKLPTKGDEQVVDVELDKDTVTIVNPVRTGYVAVNAKVHWESLSKKADKAQQDDATPLISFKKEEDKIPGEFNYGCNRNCIRLDPLLLGSYNELLTSLLPQFPMTLKGALFQICWRSPPNTYDRHDSQLFQRFQPHDDCPGRPL